MSRVLAAGVIVLALVQAAANRRGVAAEPIEAPPALAETVHTPLPLHVADYWLVPDAAEAARLVSDAGTQRAIRGLKLLAAGQPVEALAALLTVPDASPLADRARLAAAVALSDLGRLDEAEAMLLRLAARAPVGLVAQQAAMRLADVAVARATAAEVEPVVRRLAEGPLSAPADVWLKVGALEEAAGHPAHAVDAYRLVYDRWPSSPSAADVKGRLGRLDALAIETPQARAAELQRAELLYDGRQWSEAHAAFSALAPLVDGIDAERVALRRAEAEYHLTRHAAARDALRPLIGSPRFGAEARYFDMLAARDMGQRVTALALARELVQAEPGSPWAAEALNGIATDYIRGDDDEAAERVLRDLLSRFPRHRHAERAAWRVGWWAYRRGAHAEAAAVFDRAAATFPRADSRPAWLYWSGRARDQVGDRETAAVRYRLAVADYGNSYYGRLAAQILQARREPPLPHAVVRTGERQPGDDLPTAPVIRVLIAAGLADHALDELQFAQRAWGDSPRLLATIAWLRHRQAVGLSGTERFTALRGAINTMRRAYPQFLASGGEQLPPELLRVIFPLDYWPLISKYAAAHDLDPFLLAALMAQESTFTAEIRSSANAYGLMQVIPATGRTVARKIGLRGFTVAMLRQPETNVRIGTQYFKDLVARFGGAHFALAGYNAGPNRVVTWRQEAPDVPADEFIDNIPFAETQTYVKRILGTAEDYRRLYGGGRLDPNAGLSAALPGADASQGDAPPIARSHADRPRPVRR